jgi:hypothetical protein
MRKIGTLGQETWKSDRDPVGFVKSQERRKEDEGKG